MFLISDQITSYSLSRSGRESEAEQTTCIECCGRRKKEFSEKQQEAPAGRKESAAAWIQKAALLNSGQ